ncbi:hypothetical protein BJD99_00400 [Rhodococcus sp. 1163]|nr:hypothetical protein BJD99_00400 [Rhodococcus sp. 1163]
MFSKKRGLYRKAGPPVHDGLVGRQFTAQERSQIWTSQLYATQSRRGIPKMRLCTPIVAVRFAPESSYMNCPTTDCKVQWVVFGHVETMP